MGIEEKYILSTLDTGSGISRPLYWEAHLGWQPNPERATMYALPHADTLLGHLKSIVGYKITIIDLPALRARNTYWKCEFSRLVNSGVEHEHAAQLATFYSSHLKFEVYNLP